MEGMLAPFVAEAEALVLVYAGVFSRISAALAVLPGIGERAVPVRVKLGVALGLALLLAPMVAHRSMPVPATPLELLGLILAEAAAGLVIGLAFRFLVMALQIAGAVAAQHVGVAQLFGGIAAEAEPSIATLLGLAGTVLAMMAGLHVALVAALAELYAVLPFGTPLSGAMAAEWGAGRVAETFALGVSLALPFVVAGFLYNLALGAMSRAMPQLLVSLVGAPFVAGLGFAVLWLSTPSIMGFWGETMSRVFADPLGAAP